MVVFTISLINLQQLFVVHEQQSSTRYFRTLQTMNLPPGLPPLALLSLIIFSSNKSYNKLTLQHVILTQHYSCLPIASAYKTHHICHAQ